MKRLTLTTTEQERLDVALAKTLNISRSQAQKYIKEGRILFEGKPVTPHLSMAPASVVELLKEETDGKEVAPPLPLEILYEDEDVIVVNKPAGVLVHNAPGSHEATLVDSLLAYNPKMKKASEDENRPGIVHRLDKEASGVIIAAKNPAAFRHLKHQFAERLTKKYYTVLVMGKVKEAVGTIRFPIARSTTRARMAARPESQEGREAITHFTTLEHFTTSSLLDVQIETGRTHQIRAHFFALGYPVAGDTLYSRSDIKPVTDLHRLFLHARSLTITLPNREEKTFEAPLPQELVEVLGRLKKLV